MWVRPNADSTAATLLAMGNGGTDGVSVLMHNGDGGVAGKSYFSLGLPGVTWSTTGTSGSLPTDSWTHIAVTRDALEWRVYRNGVQIGRSVAEPNTPTESLRIGPEFSGDIDELRIWERHRTLEEIRQGRLGPLDGTEPGLTLYYDMNVGQESIVPNRAKRTGSTLDGTLWGSAEFVPCDLPFVSAVLPDVQLRSFPSYMQLVPRGRDNFGSIKAAGDIVTPGFDSMAVEVTREGKPYSYTSAPLNYIAGRASFSFSTRIRAELAEYTQQLVAIRGRERIVIAEASDLVAGDAYAIVGQSNAHPTNATVPTSNRFVRSFGIQTGNVGYDRYNIADTMWGRANSHGFGGYAAGPLLTGIWGQRLQELIVENHGIPVCIINGATGGSLMEANLPGSERIDDLSIYGKMGYRIDRAGLRNNIRAIIWAHGESEQIVGYAEKFEKLYTAWHQDYPGLEKVYVFQVRPGCVLGVAHGAVAEFQRTLPDLYPNIVVMPTAGITGHDGCHYSVDGYFEMGENIYRLLARDFYGSKDTTGIAAPYLEHAFFTDNTHQEVALVFRGTGNAIVWPVDTIVGPGSRSMGDGLFLDGTAGDVIAGRSAGDTVYLTLRAPSNAQTISYLPDLPWYLGTNDVYQGPWLRNGRGISAFAFHDQPLDLSPVTSSVEDEAPARSGIELFPNPASSYAAVRFDARTAGAADISIIDMRGVVQIQKQAGGAGEIGIDVSGLQAGVYLCRIGKENKVFSIVR